MGSVTQMMKISSDVLLLFTHGVMLFGCHQRKIGLFQTFRPYTVYPLEGLWGIQEKYLNEKVMQKKHFAYQLMIKQPGFVTKEVAQEALVQSAHKLPSELIDQLQFVTIEEGFDCANGTHRSI